LAPLVSTALGYDRNSMLQAQALRYDPKVILDYASPRGPLVIGVRGVLVQGTMTHLKSAGLFEEYVARLPEPQRDQIVEALAASWVPVELGVLHFATLDSMKLSERQISTMTEPFGANIFASMFAAFIAATRRAGAEASIWIGLGQAERVWSRMYDGGGCRVIRVGPKDALLETSGLPFGKSRCFRTSHCAFLRGVLSVATRTCVVKEVPSAGGRPDCVTVAISWV
jgi:hypothetical protein